jgi:2-polyprenyl-3-methyl-5-hydroxy-6-metoxy-1,4-benzoquinol methylase
LKFQFYEQAPKEVVTECNLCGSSRLTPYTTTDRYGFDAPTVKCKDCGLVFLSKRMTAAAYREFYEGGHYRRLLEEKYGREYPLSMIESDQMRYARSLAAWLKPHMGRVAGGKLLDLGGATGVVAEGLAKEFGLVATVVEPSLAEADRARFRGLSVEQVRLEDYSPNGTRYDLVILCRTVDHLLDIKTELTRIRSWLATGGLFFLDFVGSNQRPVIKAGRLIINEKPETKIDHPFYLTSKTMRRYLEQAGFRVEAVSPSADWRHIKMLCEAA